MGIIYIKIYEVVLLSDRYLTSMGFCFPELELRENNSLLFNDPVMFAITHEDEVS